MPDDVVKLSDARAFATTGFNNTPLNKSAGDFGAIYYPWIKAADPIGVGRNPQILLPPSGFIAGLYARIDNSRGVFKAPAGTEAGVGGALAVATEVSDTEQDQLNPISVNVIRRVPGSGFVVWGTRTIGSDPAWRYIPVRRMAIFLRTSIYYGIQWAVFEPNDEPLWSSLRLNIRSFMLTQFRAGAFQGSRPDDAFFVKCDSSTTTQQDIDNGVVNILVGFAPLKPAEFVVLKLSQKVSQPAV
jgi:phage tail sheath protein FI